MPIHRIARLSVISYDEVVELRRIIDVLRDGTVAEVAVAIDQLDALVAAIESDI